METHGREEEKEAQVNSAKATPEGFIDFFRSYGEVPEPPTDRLVELDELGISLHYCYALHRLGTASVAKELGAIDSELQTVLPKLEGHDLELLDRYIFAPGEMNCSRLTYGAIDLEIGPLIGGFVLKSNAYLIVTIHNAGLVSFTLTMHLADGEGKLNAEKIQDLEDAYYYDEENFKIAGTTKTLVAFFKELREKIVKVLPDLPNVRPLKYFSVSIKRTTPPFENATKFAAQHAYEMVAMLGEEADWRQAEKSTVREILCYGLHCKLDDLVVPQEFASVAFNGSPEPWEPFDKFGIFYEQVLDIHDLAASTAFLAMRKLLDSQIEACTTGSERDYQRLIKETNQLLSRHLRIKQCFTHIDHVWADKAFVQYVNYHLELYTATRKATLSESLDDVMERLRALTSQMASIVQRDSESRTNRALQIVSVFLSGAAILDLVKLLGSAYSLDAFGQFWIGLSAWGAVALTILLVGLLRR